MPINLVPRTKKRKSSGKMFLCTIVREKDTRKSERCAEIRSDIDRWMRFVGEKNKMFVCVCVLKREGERESGLVRDILQWPRNII